MTTQTNTETVQHGADSGIGEDSTWIARYSLPVATLLAGLFAGFFVAYEISVTRGLAEVDDMTYIQTFQWINATVQTPTFAVIFFGTVPALAIALAFNRRSAKSTVVLLASALVMAIATVAITFAGNVPLNLELAEFETLTPEIAAAARLDALGAPPDATLRRLDDATASCIVFARKLVSKSYAPGLS